MKRSLLNLVLVVASVLLGVSPLLADCPRDCACGCQEGATCDCLVAAVDDDADLRVQVAALRAEVAELKKLVQAQQSTTAPACTTTTCSPGTVYYYVYPGTCAGGSCDGMMYYYNTPVYSGGGGCSGGSCSRGLFGRRR